MEGMGTFEVLERGDVIVGSSEELGVIVVWSGSATFNVYAPDGLGGWTNTDVFTRYGAAKPGGPCSFDEAMQAGKEYMEDLAAELGADQ